MIILTNDILFIKIIHLAYNEIYLAKMIMIFEFKEHDISDIMKILEQKFYSNNISKYVLCFLIIQNLKYNYYIISLQFHIFLFISSDNFLF